MKKLLFVTLLFFSCGDSMDTDITITDENCNIIEEDTSDWIGNCNPACPNPADQVTKLSYSLSQTSFVELIITEKNDNSDTVRTLVSSNQTAGNFEVFWVLGDDTGQELNNGIYTAILSLDGVLNCQGDIQIMK